MLVLLLPLSLSHVPDSLTHARPQQKRAGDAGVMKDQSKRVWGTAISTCGFLMNLITWADSSLQVFAGNKGGWAVFTGEIVYYEKDQHLKGSQVWGPGSPRGLWTESSRGFWRWRDDLFPQTWGHGVKGHLSFLMGRHATRLLQGWVRAHENVIHGVVYFLLLLISGYSLVYWNSGDTNKKLCWLTKNEESRVNQHETID